MVFSEKPTELKLVKKDLALLQSIYHKGIEEGLTISQIVEKYNELFTVHTPGPTTITLFLAQQGIPCLYHPESSHIEATIDGEKVLIPWIEKRSPDPH